MSRRKARTPNFKQNIDALRVSRVLKDITEAREHGIELSMLTLQDLYRKLKEARRQHKLFQESKRPGETFQYDSNEDQQNPYENDGLDDLQNKVLMNYRARTKKRKSKRKSQQK